MMMAQSYSPHPQQQHQGQQQPQQQQIQGHPGQQNHHGMQHMNPQQAHAYQQQQMAQAMAVSNAMHPQMAQNMAQIQQQALLIRQRQQQAAQAHIMNGMGTQGMAFNPSNGSQVRGLPNGLYVGGGSGGVPANMGFGAGNPHLRGNNLPPHLQQHLQQAQQQQQQQHQIAAAQQVAMATQAAAANAQASAMNMGGPSQQQQQQMPMQGTNPAAVAAQQQAAALAQARAAAAAAQKPGLGTFILKLHQFANHLASFEFSKQPNDIKHWQKFVSDFYSPSGHMRQILLNNSTGESKQFEMPMQVLARYYFTMFEGGVKLIQLVLENAREKELPNQAHMVECQKASYIYWFKNRTHLIAHGPLRVTFNQNSQIESMEFQTVEFEEYLSRAYLKQQSMESPEVFKKSPDSSKAQANRPQQQALQIPPSVVKNFGVPDTVFRCLEIAETISHMKDLFNFSHANPGLQPRQALQTLVSQQSHQQALAQQHAAAAAHHHQQQQQQQQQQHQQQHQQQQQQQHQHQVAQAAAAAAQGMHNSPGHHPGGQSIIGPGGMGPGQHPGMPGGVPGGLIHSPSANEMRLGVPPSPHLHANGATPSPAQTHLQAPGLVQQHSQQNPTSNPSSQTSTTVGSANTSPNQPNKRRRASTTATMKIEEDADSGGGGTVNGTQKVKQSPRVGGNKRTKTNNSS